jgi:DNA repair protein RadA/Sms
MFPKWLGKCPDCGGWNTLVEELRTRTSGAQKRRSITGHGAQFLADITGDSAPMRPTGLDEFDRVMGGGLVAGSVNLLGGEPGIGKSTLVLQIAERFGLVQGPVLYATGEESVGQIKRRAARLKIDGNAVALLSTSELESVLAALEQIKPSLLVLDSIQTTASSVMESPAGTVAQVRAVATAIAHAAKPTETAVMLIGHVTKDGSLAGPKVLEHLVDTVLTLESDSSRQYRLLRATKNRFGATDEIGLFEMTSAGMIPVIDPSHLFLSSSDSPRIGSVVVSAVEGTRPLLFDLQALVAPAGFGTPQRVARGMDGRRLAMLLAVVERHGGLALSGRDVFVNMTGGLSIDEPSVDLGVILALASSHLNRPFPLGTVVVGEVGLGGEVRAVAQLPRMLNEAAKLGFSTALIPLVNKEIEVSPQESLHTVKVETVQDAITWLRDS